MGKPERDRVVVAHPPEEARFVLDELETAARNIPDAAVRARFRAPVERIRRAIETHRAAGGEP